MTRKKIPEKRAYLARDERRLALLDVAAAVVEKQGWPALSMIAVAEAAQVSRQLVYQHFTSVDELMADTMSHLFRNRYESLRGGIQGNTQDLAQLVQIADQQTFDGQPGRVRALWQMITATFSDNVETARMSTRLRHLLVRLWAPPLQQHFQLDERNSQALAWMLNMAFWGAHQLVHDGEISRESANQLFTWMILRLKGGSGALPMTPASASAPPRKDRNKTKDKGRASARAAPAAAVRPVTRKAAKAPARSSK